MQYFDKNGKEIKAGMKILMEDGSVELVYDTEDAYSYARSPQKEKSSMTTMVTW